MSVPVRVWQMVAVVCVLAASLSAMAWSQTFDVVAIKPASPEESGAGWHRTNSVTKISNYPLLELLQQAYNLKVPSQVVGLPPWADKDHFDLEAKYSSDDTKRMNALPDEEQAAAYRASLRAVLADRFGLRGALESRRMPRFALERVSSVPGEVGSGLHLLPAGPDGRPAGGYSSRTSSSDAKAFMEVSGLTMTNLADQLSGQYETGDRIVVDHTGLTGFFKFHLDYAPDRGLGISPEATLPGLLDAMRQQLGLKLVKDEGDVPVFVVTAVRKPEFD